MYIMIIMILLGTFMPTNCSCMSRHNKLYKNYNRVAAVELIMAPTQNW